MEKVLDKLRAWESENYLASLKLLLGVVYAIPTVGLYGVVQAFYLTHRLSDLLTCLLVVVAGSVLATLVTLAVYNEFQDERRASVRRHPVVGKRFR